MMCFGAAFRASNLLFFFLVEIWPLGLDEIIPDLGRYHVLVLVVLFLRCDMNVFMGRLLVISLVMMMDGACR
jgi:hypothetical protein